MRESYTWRQVIGVAVGNPVLHAWNIAQTLLCNLGDVIVVCDPGVLYSSSGYWCWFGFGPIIVEWKSLFAMPTVSINVPDPVLQVMKGVPVKICYC